MHFVQAVELWVDEKITCWTWHGTKISIIKSIQLIIAFEQTCSMQKHCALQHKLCMVQIFSLNLSLIVDCAFTMLVRALARDFVGNLSSI